MPACPADPQGSPKKSETFQNWESNEKMGAGSKQELKSKITNEYLSLSLRDHGLFICLNGRRSKLLTTWSAPVLFSRSQ